MSELTSNNEIIERYKRLRNLALNWSPRSSKSESGEFLCGKVFGAVMEFVLSGANVTLFCLSTGDASLYTSRGFGVVGGFAHDRVRSSSRTFVEQCENCRSEMMTVNEFPAPCEGVVRFYALTELGVLMVETAEGSLGISGDLAMLKTAGHTVISELRKVVSAN